MMARLFIFAIEIWLFVACLLFLLASGSMIFKKDLSRFARQIEMCVIWPIALMTKTGRKHLVETFKDIWE
jgi:hypothetical protein